MPIRVVQITENPIAGAPINLSRALNKWSKGEVESRHIAASDRNENRVFHSDIIIGKNSFEEIKSVIEGADILHFHNFYSKQKLFKEYPELWKVALTKKRVWQAHSQRTIEWMDITEGLRDRHAKHLVIGQYHPRMWPECQVVPNVIDITEDLLRPIPRQNNPPRVAFSPSRIRLRGWDNKGYDETVPTLQKLVNNGQITAEVIFDKTHEECLRLRGKADIAIDEIVTGSYHLCSLEALSQGCVTIAGLDDLQVATLKELTGAISLPWVVATPQTLHRVLLKCISEPAWIKCQQEISRSWMEKFWHPEVTVKKFVDIYRSL
jgi:hypothetical protein